MPVSAAGPTRTPHDVRFNAELVQVYRVRVGGGSKLLIEADLRRGGASN